MNSAPPPQRTRLQQSLGGAWPRLEQWAANPWRRLSLLLMVLLVAFALGLLVGVMAMVPRWWRERKAAKKTTPPPVTVPADHGI